MILPSHVMQIVEFLLLKKHPQLRECHVLNYATVSTATALGEPTFKEYSPTI